MGSKLSTHKKATVPPPGDDATLPLPLDRKEAPPTYDTQLQSHTFPGAPKQHQHEDLGVKRLYPPGKSQRPADSLPQYNWDTHVVASGQGRFLQGRPYVVITAQSRRLWGRPIVIVGSRCIRDVGLGFHEGEAICILSFYRKLKLALFTESDKEALKRLEDCKQAVLTAAKKFMGEIVERRSKMIVQPHDIEHWWILHTILCWDAVKVELSYKDTVHSVVLHVVEVEEHLRWIRLHGVAEGDSQQPFCVEFDPETSGHPECTFDMKLVVVEGFDPRPGDAMGNISKADAILKKNDLQSLDLRVLPELAFSGYEDVQDFEVAKTGTTSLWVRRKAIDYKCVAIAGYAEKDETGNDSPMYYNSATVVNRDGEFIGNYRKEFLHPYKDTWASCGGEYFSKLIPGLGRVSLGISTDLNRKNPGTPLFAYELAYETIVRDSELLILPMAWWPGATINTKFAASPLMPWISRLEPFLFCDRKDGIICVFANRVGTEGKDVYIGRSAVVKIQHKSVRVYGVLDSTEEDLLIVETMNSPVIGKDKQEDMSGNVTPLSDTDLSDADLPDADLTEHNQRRRRNSAPQ
ncbi:carbon-nitrogen hydrolase [Cadophora sp. DSE1049]|nr:carbon-nitrogen hydrolase [Cadophora sp. DSE1049]